MNVLDIICLSHYLLITCIHLFQERHTDNRLIGELICESEMIGHLRGDQLSYLKGVCNSGLN